ncbi:MAG: NB-ARC domain-containing protein [Crinalium sp.]
MTRAIINLAGGQAFKQLLRSKKISEYKLAQTTGINKGLINQWVTGIVGCPKPENLEKLAVALEMDVDELINIFTNPLENNGNCEQGNDRTNSNITLAPPTTTPNRYHSLDGIPDILGFIGRENDVNKLQEWLLNDRIRVLAILGQGGIGKSAISAKLTQQIQYQFEYVIWRSLHDAPPLKEILAELLHFFSHPNSRPNSASTNVSISELLKYLRSHRCLLILDDWETILKSGDLAGYYRSEYEDYSELLQRIGTEKHQSCLIINSREQPQEISLLATVTGATGNVRFLKLDGLEPEEAKEILKQQGFCGDEKGLEDFIWQLRGNPYALKIISQTVYHYNSSNFVEFLQATSLILADVVSQFLSQQFQRISAIEKEIMYWLAIEQPVSQKELQDNIVPRLQSTEVTNALTSLSRRSLIEIIAENGKTLYSLEPVIKKYIINQLIKQVSEDIYAVIETKDLTRLGLLKSHRLVKESATEETKAIQTRLIVKRIKDNLLRIITGDIQAQLNQISELASQNNLTVVGYTQANIQNLLVALQGEQP